MLHAVQESAEDVLATLQPLLSQLPASDPVAQEIATIADLVGEQQVTITGSSVTDVLTRLILRVRPCLDLTGSLSAAFRAFCCALPLTLPVSISEMHVSHCRCQACSCCVRPECQGSLPVLQICSAGLFLHKATALLPSIIISLMHCIAGAGAGAAVALGDSDRRSFATLGTYLTGPL